MISFKNTKSYCCDDISLIENYDKAINDNTQIYDCHHRLEIDLNLSIDELKERGLYNNRPASELIFLTRSEHRRLHCPNGVCDSKGTYYNDTHRKNISKAKKELYSNPIERKKQSERLRGKHKNRRWMTKDLDHVFIHQEQFDYYLNLGYHFGRK